MCLDSLQEVPGSLQEVPGSLQEVVEEDVEGDPFLLLSVAVFLFPDSPLPSALMTFELYLVASEFKGHQ